MLKVIDSLQSSDVYADLFLANGPKKRQQCRSNVRLCRKDEILR